MTISNNQPPKYRIVEYENGMLKRDELETVLQGFPMEYRFAKEETDPREVYNAFDKGTMEVYHHAGVISLFPENGYRVACATVTDWDFPIRADNMMDDTLGLRCCFHPRLSLFGIRA